MVKDVLKRELIGCAIEVTGSANRDLVGVRGKIIDETKYTLVIQNQNKEKKTLLKNQITFIITIKNKRIEIDGKKINKRPEKRI